MADKRNAGRQGEKRQRGGWSQRRDDVLAVSRSQGGGARQAPREGQEGAVGGAEGLPGEEEQDEEGGERKIPRGPAARRPFRYIFKSFFLAFPF